MEELVKWLEERKAGWIFAQSKAIDRFAKEKYFACEEEIKVVLAHIKQMQNEGSNR